MPGMGRREFVSLFGGAVSAWPVAARAQQADRMRRIGVLVGNLPAGDPEWQARGNAFVQGLQERGWSDGRNLRIEYRWGLGDPDRLRKYATELVALAPDHSITSSASNCMELGTVKPSAVAVLRFITSSNLAACITGKSAGFSPLRIRPA